MHIKLFSLNELVLNCSSINVSMPGVDGEFSILPSHCFMISVLKPGLIKILQNNKFLKYFIYQGIVEIDNDNIIVIADFIINIESVSIEWVENNINTLQKHYEIDSIDSTSTKRSNSYLLNLYNSLLGCVVNKY